MPNVEAPTQPDSEEYEVLLTELTGAKKTLHQLKLLAEYNTVKFTPKLRSHGTLLSYLQRGESKRREGAALDADITAQSARVGVLERLLDGFNARNDLWAESQTVDAPDPKVDA